MEHIIIQCMSCGDYFASHLQACPNCETQSPVFLPPEIVISLDLGGDYLGTKGKQKGNKVKADGYTFDSETEYKRYQNLKTCVKHGLISNLEVHPRFELLAKIPKLQSAISYTADFGYMHEAKYIVEDVKGRYGKSKRNDARGLTGKPIISPESRLRHKLLIALLYLKYGDKFEFKIVTDVSEF